jgi:SAM-dependent methyltransferase
MNMALPREDGDLNSTKVAQPQDGYCPLKCNKGVGYSSYFEHHYGNRSWKFYSQIVAQVASWSEPGPILDIGAGTGLFAECATRWGLDCTGVEGSREAIEIALARCPELRIRHHLLSEPLPFSDDSFQTVLINQVIEHLEPAIAKQVLRESRRVLREGGTVIVSSPSRYNKADAEGDPTHLNVLVPSELRSLLEDCGFKEIKSHDGAQSYLGNSRVGRILTDAAFRVTRWDFLSSTANCWARK